MLELSIEANGDGNFHYEPLGIDCVVKWRYEDTYDRDQWLIEDDDVQVLSVWDASQQTELFPVEELMDQIRKGIARCINESEGRA